MVNLLEIVRQAQGGAYVDLFARQFGLAPDQARRAMEAMMPAFAMGLERNAAINPAGFAEILRAGHPMLAFFEAPQGSGTQAFSPQARAQGDLLLGPLFGSPDVGGEVVRQAAAMTGVAAPVLRQMLPILAGVVVACLVHAALNQDYAAQFGRFVAAMQGHPASRPAEPQTPDLFGMMLGRPAPPPPPRQPTPFEAMGQLFEAGRALQDQQMRALQAMFDAVWGRAAEAPVRRLPAALAAAFLLALAPGQAEAQGDPRESGQGTTRRARRPETAPAACRPAGRTREVLAAVGPRGDLVLASGARARLDGLRWPDEAEAAARARAWLEARRGRPLALDWRGETDRWGRRAANAVSEAGDGAGKGVDGQADGEADGEASVDLAAGLVAAGLAVVDAGEADALCRPGLLVVEGAARGAGRGLWASALHRADEAARLSAAAGRFVVAEGRVRSVGERRAWTYLNFAAPGAESLTVTLARRTWRRLAERGLDATALRGRRVRARGVVELRRGPTLEVTAPELLEVLDGAGREESRDRSRGVAEGGSGTDGGLSGR